MKTFTGKYSNGNFVYSGDNESIKSQLISILNTPIGSRFYYPSYGSNLNKYKFSVLNHFSINIIGQEIKNAVSLIDGVALSNFTYTISDNKLLFNIELNRLSETVKVNLTVDSGVAY